MTPPKPPVSYPGYVRAHLVLVELQKTTVYVSGGASGLGAATVDHLSAAGAQVGILDLDLERGEQVADRVGGAFARCDVSSAESMEAAFAALVDRLGPPRVAVACAGIGAGKKLVGRSGPYPLDAFERVIGVNLNGCSTSSGSPRGPCTSSTRSVPTASGVSS